MATKKTAAKSPEKTASKTATTKSVPAKATPAKEAPAKSVAAKTTPTHKEIADLAHRYHTERGHRHGSDLEDWLRAEKELKS